MASCGQLPSGSLTVRVRESALGQNVSTLELSDQTCQTPGRVLTAESGGLEVRAAGQSRTEFTRSEVCTSLSFSVTHHGLLVLHHWNLLSQLKDLLSQLKDSQARFVQTWSFELFS